MASRNPERPNIILILTDDQGAWALGCYGNSEIRTPNLNRLADNGVRFENFFCASPVCSPARASLLTGRIPSQHGVHDWIRSGNLPSSSGLSNTRKDDREIEYLEGLRAYTDFLAEDGYTCGLSGKWHLGKSIKPQRGFTSWMVTPWGASDYYNPVIIRSGKPANEVGYMTDIITIGALDFLDAQSANGNPFYLSVHYTAPHAPWAKGQHPSEIVDLYAPCPFMSCPDGPAHPWLFSASLWLEGDRRREMISGYFAAVTAMDAGVGKILAKLEQLSLENNTLVIFCSDNGMNMGHHGIFGKGNATFPQNMYDTSVKVPLIVSWKDHIPAGSTSSALCSQYDVMPTLLDLLKLENPEAPNLPGRSFLPILLDPHKDCDEPVVVFDEYGPVRMIRSKEWKYVHRYPYGPNELYDLVNDPGEQNNLVEDLSRASIIQGLRAQLENWFNRYAIPDLDGSRLPVYGRGQKNLAGWRGMGETAFFSSIETPGW